MRKVFAMALLSLISAAVFAAPNSSVYECESLRGVEEYRVGIDLNSGEASFFDNDSISYMKLTQTRNLEIFPPQTLMTFEGKAAGYSGALLLYFNLTKKTVTLYSIDKRGKRTEIGKASCINAEPIL